MEWLADVHRRTADPEGDFYLYYFRLERYLRTRLLHDTGQKFADDWLAFYDIFTSPWWTGAWVYQEFLSSAEIHVLHGRSGTLGDYFGVADLSKREAQLRETLLASTLPRVMPGNGESGPCVLEVQGYYIGDIDISSNPPVASARAAGTPMMFGNARIRCPDGGRLSALGDQFWALIGSRNPFVLRKMGEAYQVMEEAEFNKEVDLVSMAQRCGLESQTLVIG
ncbi:hypothetical protein B0H63DRAFT_528207 [Podospora didyma]|uniref:Uncharacterized protein n=1 Tax=Podospora didyma TaxID=330526 RepID=A0AAE0K6Q9_9PEZI|nr:hypothetical protein B0H63DRAFT_528207 [Podospora didyma]